ncbi:hypothetical protein FIBSPDRAFT_609789 [Athelia psychrophila]|uniref:Uncharacterized protein n=1 Tax=Athelia psychrophila TaxID=1759441 RepID=A0A166BJ02_9AGAM|nr:hypothetical protein FIBSPDRAFT_151596 [Fibularhizoctonia sp. CBS 109695]KZP17913.1 hypothetical protein FIBSPDRAFT_609789 [Fibularhizoctonia sp. CBS 109695]
MSRLLSLALRELTRKSQLATLTFLHSAIRLRYRRPECSRPKILPACRLFCPTAFAYFPQTNRQLAKESKSWLLPLPWSPDTVLTRLMSAFSSTRTLDIASDSPIFGHPFFAALPQ